jgi:hypothetical protein
LQFSLQAASPEIFGYTFVYLSEIWTLNQRDDHRRNEDILEEYEVDSVGNKSAHYK